MQTQTEHCAVCGAPFYCGRNDAECWCASLPPLTPAPGRGCLCRKCLEEELRLAGQRDG